MSQPPSCSVVMAVRDEEVHIVQAVGSVLAQNNVDLDLIVVNDNSCDGTDSKLRQFTDVPNVRLLENPGVGKCSAFNFGVSLAKGDFICLFAGDDIMPPGSLAARCRTLRQADPNQPTVALSKIRIMSERRSQDQLVVPRRRGVGSFSGASFLMNVRAARLLFPVPQQLPNEDTWMALIAQHLPGVTVIHTDVVGCNWRVHKGNSTGISHPFAVHSARLASRSAAVDLFVETFAEEISDSSHRKLAAAMACEKARASGDIAGVLRSPLPMIDRLRALSTTRPLFYRLHQKMYAITGGH